LSQPSPDRWYPVGSFSVLFLLLILSIRVVSFFSLHITCVGFLRPFTQIVPCVSCLLPLLRQQPTECDRLTYKPAGVSQEDDMEFSQLFWQMAGVCAPFSLGRRPLLLVLTTRSSRRPATLTARLLFLPLLNDIGMVS
jgi:hypothetical protein